MTATKKKRKYSLVSARGYMDDVKRDITWARFGIKWTLRDIWKVIRELLRGNIR